MTPSPCLYPTTEQVRVATALLSSDLAPHSALFQVALGTVMGALTHAGWTGGPVVIPVVGPVVAPVVVPVPDDARLCPDENGVCALGMRVLELVAQRHVTPEGARLFYTDEGIMFDAAVTGGMVVSRTEIRSAMATLPLREHRKMSK